jgi:hypothetical protein
MGKKHLQWLRMLALNRTQWSTGLLNADCMQCTLTSFIIMITIKAGCLRRRWARSARGHIFDSGRVGEVIVARERK